MIRFQQVVEALRHVFTLNKIAKMNFLRIKMKRHTLPLGLVQIIKLNKELIS